MTRPFFGDLKRSLQASSWIVLGTTAILLVVVLVLAIENTRREKRYISQVLSIKGRALIRAVEAGTRTGMMGWQWGGRQVQHLLEETARLPDVRYMALVDETGNILAHSDPTRVGSKFHKKIVQVDPNQKSDWELVNLKDGHQVFEVYRPFRPLTFRGKRFNSRHGMMMRHHGMRAPIDDDDWFDLKKQKGLLIAVGMDVAPFKEVIAAEIRTTIILSVVLLLLGFSGMISLFWMHHYRTTKKSLRDTSAFADEVVIHLPVGLIATDANGNVAFFNAAAEKISGKTGSQVKGLPVNAIMPDELCAINKRLKVGDSITETEIECRFDNGHSVPLSVSATRIVNEIGEFVGNILILRDLGEVRQLQEAVRRQEKLAAVGGLAAGVAHEIRNPLSSIKGMATYLAGLFEEKSDPRKAADVMVQEVDRLNRTITELLEFARPTHLNCVSMDIESLLKRSLQLIQPDARAHQVVTELTLSKNLCMVWIDPDRMLQCLLNLYLNAIESMTDGGRLYVIADMDTIEQLRLRICDTGAGIASENLSNIFNPYFTTKPSGTGLGLAISYKLITAHKGGHMSVASLPEKGTTFTILLPCKNSR